MRSRTDLIAVCVIAGAALAGSAAGCSHAPAAGDQPVRREARGVARPGGAVNDHEPITRDTMERIDAPAGAPFVIPVDPAILRTGEPAKALRLLLDDGLELESTLYRVSLRPHRPDQHDPWDSWLPPRGDWECARISATDAAALLATQDGAQSGFALLVEPKVGRADNAVWLGSERVPMQWLPSLDTLTIANPALADGPWTNPLAPAARDQPQVRDAITREASSPLTRWRAKLLRTGLRPEPAGGENTPSTDGFADTLLESLARQQELRWRVALARLWSFSPALCEHVKQRIGAVAEVSPGVYAPVWEQDQTALDRLLLDLLGAHTTAERRAQLAEQWLAERPQATAWVVDEGGSFIGDDPATRMPCAVITLVNLSPEPQTSWSGLDRDRAPSDLTPMPPLSCDVVPLPLRGAQGAPHAANVHVGNWAATVPLLPTPLHASPPGIATGLFHAEVDAAGFLAGNLARRPDASWETAAILHRPARTQAVMPEHRRWEVYAECRLPADADRTHESILLYTGPFGAPTAAWRVGHDGSITSLRTQDQTVMEELGPEVARATITDLPDRWIARVPAPAGSIEDQGFFRIGIVRIDARGQRTAWPRAMTPWRNEPSRACIDLSAWGE